MKERPILFQGAMVRAILDGSKTQTRRIITGPRYGMKVNRHPAYASMIADEFECIDDSWTFRGGMLKIDGVTCPHGKPGDRLWVRETFAPIYPQDPAYNNGEPIEYDYAATYKHGDRLGDFIGVKKVWKPSIHMPRAASRINLEITGVKVERLNDISEGDVIKEGCPNEIIYGRGWYRILWESIYGRESWEANPLVWVLEWRVGA